MLFLIVSTLIKFVVFGLLFTLPMATILTWMERRQSAYSQDRRGPERAHFLTVGGKPLTLFGLLHPLADGLKTFFKEPFVPGVADATMFKVAPLIGFVTAFGVLAMIPFGPDIATSFGNLPLQITRLDAGILIIFAISSLSIYGVVMAGWASGSRFAMLGGLRAAAQALSYEIALGLTVVGVLIIFGSTELSQIVLAQDGLIFGLLPRWGIFYQPLAAVLFLTAAMAETKRTPFDMPEAESEIIGYFLEYSSMDFGLFMLTEFIEVVLLSAVFTTLFLGGWQLPWVLGDHSLYVGFASLDIGPWLHGILGFLIFGFKVFLCCIFQLQVRWSSTRFRYDQLMNLGWKMLLPLALFNIFITAVLTWLDPGLNLLASISLLMIGLFVLVVIAGPKRHLAVEH